MATDTGISLPKWFTVVMSGLAALAVPWAAWVTMTLAQISVRIEVQTELRRDTNDLRRDITTIQQDIIRVQATLSDTERRLLRVEKSIDSKP